MPDWHVIRVHIVDQSPPCRLCGTPKIEWSYESDDSIWLCFTCDINEDDDDQTDED